MSNNNEIPDNRQEWSKLDWMEAQSKLGTLLLEHNFIKIEEFRFSNGKRADIILERNTENAIYFGIIEVKTYKKLTRKIEKDAINQLCRYMNMLYKKVKNNNKWGIKSKYFFGVVVYTNDYPGIPIPLNSKEVEAKLPKDLIKNNNFSLFSCTPENLITKLNNRNLTGLKQKKLGDFF